MWTFFSHLHCVQCKWKTEKDREEQREKERKEFAPVFDNANRMCACVNVDLRARYVAKCQLISNQTDDP